MTFRASISGLLISAFVLAAVPALAGTTDAGSLEARVDRLLWQLANDERYSHLPVAAHYERLRAALLDQACLSATAPCAALDRAGHEGRTITAEIRPEQVEAIEQLLLMPHSAQVTATNSPAQLFITAAD
ncbi:MAG: hypothetical protein ACO1PZ_16565 [Gammaproteobacteria bacterium]